MLAQVPTLARVGLMLERFPDYAPAAQPGYGNTSLAMCGFVMLAVAAIVCGALVMCVVGIR